jgi:hypothetical protein
MKQKGNEFVKKGNELIQDSDAFRDSAVAEMLIDLHWWKNQ